MKIAMISNDHRTEIEMQSGATYAGVSLDFIDHVEYYYPSITPMNWDLCTNKFYERGRYFDLLIRALYRDMKLPWRYLDSDAEYWYFFIKNRFFEQLKKYDCVVFSNVPHEGLDIILADLTEDLGKRWYAPLQCVNGEASFQIFTNGFSIIQNSASVRLSKPQKIPFGVRHQDENRQVIRAFRKKVRNPPITLKLLDRLSRIHRKYSQIPIKQKLHESEHYGLVALHMQPELTTEPLAGQFANPITWIEKLSTMMPDIHWVVKEHPDSSDRFRGNLFAKYINHNVDIGRYSYLPASSKLNLDQFQVVSTINGTIGLEALLVGIPVICHSCAHYSDVTGVELIDLQSTPGKIKNLKLPESELHTNRLFKGLTEPYSLSLYGNDELELGWKNFFREVCNSYSNLNV